MPPKRYHSDDDFILYDDVFPHHKKTKIQKERSKIIRQIEKMQLCSNDTLENQILDSTFSIEKKAKLLYKINVSDNKVIPYIKNVLKLQKLEKKINKKSPEKTLLHLRENLDNAILGHNETKEEIIDYVSGNFSSKGGSKSVQFLALHGPAGVGKCLSLNTPILMFNGETKMVQDVVVGDIIMGDDSELRNVLTLGNGKDVMYKITQADSGKTYTVNSEHILSLFSVSRNCVVDIPIKEYLALESKDDLFGWTQAIEFPENKLLVQNQIDNHIYYENFHDSFKFNSLENRNKVFNSILKLSGKTVGNHIHINFENPRFGEDVYWLISSLGVLASHKPDKIIIFADRQNSLEKIIITKQQENEYYGFTIDGNRRFVLGNFVVTHNTRFIRTLGKSLDLPFNQISFGGLNDPSILCGHDYTYIGSKPGRIFDCIVNSKNQNTIIYLDEIDKIASPDSDKFTAINGVLTHLLDPEQNSEFQDNYLGTDFKLDLSKVFFIVSFNNIENIDPIVLNRLKVIKIKGSTLAEKIDIVRKFSIPDACKNLNINVNVPDDVIKYIVLHKADKEPGMRSVNKLVNTLISKINTLDQLETFSNNSKTRICKGLAYEKINISILKKNECYTVSKELVDNLLPTVQKEAAYMAMYM